VIAAVLLYTYAIAPLISGGAGGGNELDAERALLANYRKSVAMQEVYQKALADRRKTGPDLTARLLSGSTPALAAAELSNLIRSYAEQSNVYINRENVNPAKNSGEHQQVSLQLSITSDVIGLRDFLSQLQSSEKLLDVENLQINSRTMRTRKPGRYTSRGRINPASEETGEVELSMTMVVSGYILPRESVMAGRQAGGSPGARGGVPAERGMAGRAGPDTMGKAALDTAGRTIAETPGKVAPGATVRATPQTPRRVTPETMKRATPETTRRVAPETTGRAAPDTTGRVAPDTTGRAFPETTGREFPAMPGQESPDTTKEMFDFGEE
jgi:hypothetical protein